MTAVDQKLKLLMRAYWTFAVLAVLSLFGLALAHADEAGSIVPATPAEQLALTVFAGLATILVSIVGWVATHASAWLKAHVKSQALGNVLVRASDSIFSSVKSEILASQQAIDAAKKPDSPGGATITSDELKGIKELVWKSLKDEYGGMAGLSKFLGVLGLSGEDGVAAWIDQRIEAAVHDTTKAGAAPLS